MRQHHLMLLLAGFHGGHDADAGYQVLRNRRERKKTAMWFVIGCMYPHCGLVAVIAIGLVRKPLL